MRERPLPSGAGTHFAIIEGGTLAPVENEDVLWSIVRFERGVTGTIESSRVAVGSQARHVFSVTGSEGAVAWDFERMNELLVYRASDDGDAGYTRVLIGRSIRPSGASSRGRACRWATTISR